ncbi:MAG: Npt1/Npt2 family nucleotide transporter [Acidobacteriota bacterium]
MANRATQLAMPVAAVMIAHQVASKAVRDATFLSAWPVSRLPAMVIATAVLVVLAVPAYSWLMERVGSRRVVAGGFLLSALIHLVEFRFSGQSPWVAVAIYLHVAGFGGLLLSGFWSVISDLVDPRTARVTYGRIAAAGTLGGLIGGLSAAHLATTSPEGTALVMLAGLHAFCGIGVVALGRQPAVLLPSGAGSPQGLPSASKRPAPGRVFEFDVLRHASHLRRLAAIVLLGAASAVIADYLLKVSAVQRIGTGANLLQFFATFYVVVQGATFLAQLAVGQCVRRFGLGRTISALPMGVSGAGILGLLYPTFPMFVGIRGVEAVLRGSLFRSAYELIFVPMAADEKRRAKTFLDVTCDRAGDATGALVLQVLLLTSAAYLSAELLAAMVAMSAIGLWLGSRLDALYLGVVERRLTTHGDNTPLMVASETGWTIVDMMPLTGARLTAAPAVAPPPVSRESEPKLSVLADLRSGDRGRVEPALNQLTRPDAIDVAQVILLLAWDDVAASAGRTLDRFASAHVGLVTDALLDADGDFAIRRRLPRILGAVPNRRALDGLVGGLNDSRFEVRYQCGRAITRLLTQHPGLTIDTGRIMAVIERELSVTPQVWRGYRLLDQTEQDEALRSPAPAADKAPRHLGPPQQKAGDAQRNLEHVFTLLATVLPAEPVNVAFHGIRSGDAGLRSLAIEYLESALPAGFAAKLWALVDVTPTATPPSGDGPGQSSPPPRARRP